MKILMAFILSCLLVITCIGSTFAEGFNFTPNRDIVTFDRLTGGVEDLPINPYKVLEEWKPLLIYRPGGADIAIVISGNPKIEWSDEKIRNAPEQPIPPGEITSAVMLVFLYTSGKIRLTSFCFSDHLGDLV